ncbi:MAG: hypothetical protein H7336_04450 [Bacteriovorax sp.]|nr:hypothetical protein [Bacteriovorax sp.]
MRKLFVISAMSLMSFAALAETSVEITSYIYTNQERKVAEICGVVKEPASTPSYVKVVVDYNSKRPATYNAIAGADGKFCQVVVSYYGTAQASAF